MSKRTKRLTWGTSTNTLRIIPLLQQTMNTTNGELKSSFRRTRLSFTSSFSTRGFARLGFSANFSGHGDLASKDNLARRGCTWDVREGGQNGEERSKECAPLYRDWQIPRDRGSTRLNHVTLVYRESTALSARVPSLRVWEGNAFKP